MSVSTLAHPPRHKKALTKFWLGIALLVAIGVGIAWLGAQSVRGRTVQVETVEAGSGAGIQPVDGVLSEYEGRLQDGTVFDSSQGRGPQPLLVGQTIPGFAEALTRMQEGGRYRVQIPSRLAYGETPPPGGPVPPNADLEFDVHVVEVVPNAAIMAQQMEQQMQQQQVQLPPREDPQPE